MTFADPDGSVHHGAPTPLWRDLLIQAASHPDDDVAAEALSRLLASTGGVAGLDTWAQARDEGRLLPLLAQRDAVLGDDEELAACCDRHLAQSWGLNERLFSVVGPLLERFDAAGIPVLGLKGIALLGDIYPTHAVRPVGDVDLLVPSDRAAEALALATAMGWGGPDAYWRWYSAGGVAKQLIDPTGASVDLHLRAGRSFRLGEASAADLLPTATTLASGHPLAGTGLRRPSTAWQLVVVAAHAARPTDLGRSHWVPDLQRLAALGEPEAVTATELARHHLVAGRCRRALAEVARLMGPSSLATLIGEPTDATTEERREAIERRLAAAGVPRPGWVARVWGTTRLEAAGRGPGAHVLAASAYLGNGWRVRRSR